MSIIINLLPLILILILMAWFFRLSSRLVQKETLNWKLCLTYIIIIFFLAVGSRLINVHFGPLPYPLLIALVGFSLNVLIGTYLFGKFGKNSSGIAYGLGNGFKITMLGLGFLLIIVIIGATIVYLLGPQILTKKP